MKQYIYLLIIILAGFMISCNQTKFAATTLFSESTLSNITRNGVTMTCEILDIGSNIENYGYCYSINSNPTVNNYKTINQGVNAKLGIFSEKITGLELNTKYYIRSYITTENHTEYGNELSFSTLNKEALIDYDGNEYSVIVIGNQTWMAENLKVEHTPSGTPVTSYVYNNNTSNENIYGRLYSYDVAINVCPVNWHLPSDDEWKELESYLGMPDEDLNLFDNGSPIWRGNGQGEMMMEGGSSGLNLILAGYFIGHNYYQLDGYGRYWSSTKYSSNFYLNRMFWIESTGINRKYNASNRGFSVRCLKDE